MSEIANLTPELIGVLVCPIMRSPLIREGDFLVGEVGGLRYPIRDGIPVMLPGEAELPEGVGTIEDLQERFAVDVPI
ncbi:MAG: Trm112 family protein [Planctomycetota bacterium]|jgi:uncharacterized protein YbaR (Trm112 family)